MVVCTEKKTLYACAGLIASCMCSQSVVQKDREDIEYDDRGTRLCIDMLVKAHSCMYVCFLSVCIV